jgi:hypothetical protein
VRPEVVFEEGFLPLPGLTDGPSAPSELDADSLFAWLRASVGWDERMKARLTASFGLPYDYAGISYAAAPMPAPLEAVCARLERRLGFRPNNCLINFYLDGRSKMGFHADDVAVLEGETGVAIISLGGVRPLKFRRIGDPSVRWEVRQTPGSLLYLPHSVHRAWVHAIPRVAFADPRISLTFRRLGARRETGSARTGENRREAAAQRPKGGYARQ